MTSVRMLLIAVLAAASLILAVAVASWATESFLVQVPAVYDAEAPVPDAIKKACSVESLLGNHVFAAVSKKYPGSLQAPSASDDDQRKFLKLTITAVEGAEGGIWTGAKGLTVRAELFQSGKTLETTVLKRENPNIAARLAFTGNYYSGACPMIQEVAQLVGKDIAAWLGNVVHSAAASGEPRPAPAAARLEGKIVVLTPATYEESAPVGDAVRRECAIESAVGSHVFEEVSARFPGSSQSESTGQNATDKILKLKIVAVHGVGGGGWSGGKTITVRAELSQNGEPIATTVATRNSRGGMLGPVSGTCAIMERIATTLGKDIAAWLARNLNAATQQRRTGQ
jgi:hypothetical protein